MDNGNQIEEVKRRIDIVELISGYIALKKTGRNYKANCPFHSEKTPSFMVNPDRQIFKCFGCGEGGDVFVFLKKIEGLEFGEALKLLAGRAGVELKEYKPSAAEKRKETLLDISSLVSDIFHYFLTRHKFGKSALEYLKSRSITKESVDSFKLGFAPHQKNFLFRFLVKKGFSPVDIVASGLVIPTSDGPVDRFRGRIVFPIADIQGRVIAFSGRALGNQEPKYLNSPETPIFKKSKTLYGINLAKAAIKKEKSAVLVEGNLDVISCHQVGTENVIAPLGTALTIQQVETIKKLTDSVLFAFDTDLAGDAAARRGIKIAEEAGMNMKVVKLPSGKDPDDTIRKNPNLWRKSIKEAVPIYDYFISSAVSRFGISNGEGKRRVANEVLPLLASINDGVLLSHYLQQLAMKIGVEEFDLREIMKKYQTTYRKKDQIKDLLEKPLTQRSGVVVEKYLLALMVQSGQIEKKISPELFSDRNYQEIFKKAVDYKKTNKKWKVKSFALSLPEALLSSFDEIILLDLDEEIVDFPAKLGEEIKICANRLKELSLRKKLRELSLAIKQAEAVGNSDKIRMLSEEFRDKSKELVGIEAG